MQVGRLSNERS